MEDKVLKICDKNEGYSVSFLEKLISFDTQVIDQGKDGKEEDAQKWIANEIKKFCTKIDIFEPHNKRLTRYPDFNKGHSYKNRPNVVGIIKGKGGGRSIILNGHIDTVPPGNIDNWDSNPWRMKKEKDRLIGLGTVDMKSGLSTNILAVRYLLEGNFKPKGDIIIQSVVDEEGGGNGTLACIDRGYKADAAIVSEPTCLAIQPTHRGVMLAEVKVKGKAGHSCLKWQGVNAIEKMVKIMESLKELERKWLATRKNNLHPQPTISFGEIHGGVTATIVPDTCLLRCDVKYLPIEIDSHGRMHNVRYKDMQKEFEYAIKSVEIGDNWLKKHPVGCKWYAHVPPYWLESTHPFVKTIERETGKIIQNTVVSGFPAGSDARLLYNIAKIPTVICGPGNLRDSHTPNESVKIEEFLNAIKIFALTIMTWCGYEGGR